MVKAAGLGQNIYVGGYDLSGDVGAIQAARGSVAPLIVTGLNKSAIERIGGLRDGELAFNSWYNVAAGAEHAILKTLPTADTQVMYVDTQVIGGQAACLTGKQVDYPFSRGQDGSLAASVQAMANGAGLEWAEMLTAGKRTDGAPTNGASLDFGAVSTLFGLSAYLQVFSFTGTTITIKLQDSADNSAFADVAAAAFTAVTAAPGHQRLQTGAADTVRRYVRVATTGTFTNCIFAVAFTRHLTATL